MPREGTADAERRRELERYRAEVRAFVAEKAPVLPFRVGEWSPESVQEQDLSRQWTADLFNAHYLGASWPTEYGGLAVYDGEKERIVAEEVARAHAPKPLSAGYLASAALLEFGTEDQRRTYLPKLRTAEQVWCQLFSEPGAGSDLAGLRTRAARDGDHYIVNGQKVWTTNGHWAEMGYLLARTEPDAPKHKGISAFILDMRTPGVTVRPLREITGTADFNEIFFDDVRVPAVNMIGKPGEGWTIANFSLNQERSAIGASIVALRAIWQSLWRRLEQTPDASASLAQQADIQQRMMELYARVETLAAVVDAGLERHADQAARPRDAPIAKLFFSETYVAMAYAAVEMLGSIGALGKGDAETPDDGLWQDFFMYCRAYTIAGGSSEIMRNVIAERGLGLPR